jgi:hypothetical protein
MARKRKSSAKQTSLSFTPAKKVHVRAYDRRSPKKRKGR